jgi:hypothetical protein
VTNRNGVGPSQLPYSVMYYCSLFDGICISLRRQWMEDVVESTVHIVESII